mmetsp:Transcript_1690/g.3957  ORF Transcript_1690/g.3957 Transcript_1690/m.3957 type:complete len:548 (-) Transcript_1690:134-1777(-)|eukprot:CAMPEP_0170603488 /NCGR_PEP_ID=MMETSP0224-20130122/18937_1 /TAXON_ID=285029 /ORGANISM="Togula jolla, Strain CCCM 725" /LENGTH=547 /DNA_ID=CAMNT_0010928369 /DNA_START=78 /DNA_END=1721 /DNA_ORIENTATION=-
MDSSAEPLARLEERHGWNFHFHDEQNWELYIDSLTDSLTFIQSVKRDICDKAKGWFSKSGPAAQQQQQPPQELRGAAKTAHAEQADAQRREQKRLQSMNEQLSAQIEALKATLAQQNTLMVSQARVLYMYASPRLPKDYKIQQLKIKEEITALRNVVPLDVRRATARSIRNAISNRGVWLHISMHSVKDGAGLLFEDSEGTWYEVKNLEHMKLLLNEGGDIHIEFVFLAVCHSERFASIFHDAGVKHVVYCATEVSDKCARQFASSLYHDLANGLSIKNAFASACVVAKFDKDKAQYGLLSDGSAWLSPAMTAGALIPRSPLQPPGQLKDLPRQAENFVGRHDAIHAVMWAFACRCVVVLHCQKPFGRSATLVEIAHHAALEGRKYGGLVAFYPDPAPGGLLIVDDADKPLAGDGLEVLQRHLKHPEAKLLLGCHDQPKVDFVGEWMSIPVALRPLSDEDAAELFIRRCRRALLAGDLWEPEQLEGKGDPDRMIGLEEISPRHDSGKQLMEMVKVFAGEPGRVRSAAAKVTGGTPSLQGSLARLVLE